MPEYRSRSPMFILMVTCRDPSGNISDATPGVDSGLNVRTVVHEYGGGDFLVGDGAVYFSNFK